MDYLSKNFEGDECEFRRKQIIRGLKKGHDEMMKMTAKYLMKPPILFNLLCHRELGAEFLRAVLSVLHEHAVDDPDGDILIHEPKSDDWGTFKHDNPNQRPEREVNGMRSW